MRSSILFIILLSLSALARTQERIAHVVLGNGTELSGRVVSMQLEQLQLVIGEEIVTIPAADIKSCRFEGAPGSGNPPPPAPAGETAPVTEVEAGAEAGSEAEPETETEKRVDEAPQDSGQPQDPAPAKVPAREPKDRRTVGSEIDPAPPNGRSSLLEGRVAAIDAVYPWLRPTDPLQWASLGLLLLSGLSLIIHISVVVAGAEAAGFARSLGLSVLYLVAAFAQVAMVPTSDFAVFSMLIGNTAIALFLLRSCFGLARSNAFVAFATQVGFAGVGFGILQLIDALLGSVAAS